MKNKFYVLAALVVGTLLLSALILTKSNGVVSNPSNTAAAIKSSNVEENRGTSYSLELDIPDYQPEYLHKPQKFFSGRKIKIVKEIQAKEKSFSIPHVTLRKWTTENGKKKSIQVKSIKAEKSEEDFPVVTIPAETTKGQYTLDFLDNLQPISIPIEIDGTVDKVSTGTKSVSIASVPVDPAITYISRLGCNFCSWELSSAINPLDENYGYLAGGGNEDNLVHTTTAWKSSTIDHINTITFPFLRYYAGDPYLTFDADNKLSIVSLFSNVNSDGSSMITGGIYQEQTSKSNPLQLTQTIVKSAPLVISAEERIVFDYPKLSIDTSLTSPYRGNKYIFTNALVTDDGIHAGEGQYVITPDGQITEKISGYSNAITATVVGPHGEVYGVEPGGQEISSTTVAIDGHYLIRSFDGGKTFSQKLIVPHASQIWCSPRLSTQSQRAAPFYIGPDIAVDKNSGRIYVAWSDPTACLPDQNFEYSLYGFDFNVYVSYSDDKGETWSVPSQVDDDVSLGDQSFPSIAVDVDGSVYVAFVDHRNNKDKSQFDVYIAKSTNKGKSFSQNLQVNDANVQNAYGGARSIGDYLRMISIGEKNIYVAHPCVGNGPIENYPSDACVTVISKSAWNPSMKPIPPSDCAYITPDSVASGYPAVITAGNNRTMSMRVSNQNHAGCGASNFNVKAISPSSWQFTFPTSSTGTGDLSILSGAFGYKDINFQVPEDTPPGKFIMAFEIIDKTSGLKKSINVPIQVIKPVKITSINPTYGPPGTEVIITGESFATNNNQVTMNGLILFADSKQLPSSDGKIIYNIPSTMNTCDESCHSIPTPDGYYKIKVYANDSEASINFYVGSTPHVLPDGCTSPEGYSLTTGVKCDSLLMSSVTVTSPNGGESLLAGQNRVISWTANNVQSTDWFKIFLVRPGTGLGETDIAPVTSSFRGYSWDVPSTLGAFSDYKIRIKLCKGVNYGGDITCTTGGIAQDDSDGTFTISSPNPAPTNFSTKLAGTTVYLRWEDNATDETAYQVQRQNVTQGGANAIYMLGANTTSYQDTTAQAGITYRYSVRARLPSTLYTDRATAPDFTMPAAEVTPSIRITSPNSGTLTVGENQIISYETAGLEGKSVVISLVKYDSSGGNPGISPLLTTSSLTGTSITVPTWALPGTTYKIRVCAGQIDYPYSCVAQDESDNYLTVRSNNVLTPPEIIARLEAVIAANNTSVITPLTSPRRDFDVTGDGKVDPFDQITVRNMATLSEDRFKLAYDKIVLAITNRFNNATLYDANLDLDSDGVISSDDQDIAKDGMNGVRP